MYFALILYRAIEAKVDLDFLEKKGTHIEVLFDEVHKTVEKLGVVCSPKAISLDIVVKKILNNLKLCSI